MAQEMQQPRKIFEVIRQNRVFLSEDLVKTYNNVEELHKRMEQLEKKMEMILNVLYPPTEQPIATGDVSAEEESK